MRKCILFILISLSTMGVTAQNITTFAGNNIRTFFNGASGPNAQLAAPWGLMITRAGNIYIADRDNCAIRMLSTTSGRLTTVVGCGIGGNAGDGGAATAAYLKMPFCVVADISGNIYVSDRMNHKIRKVSPAGVITTYAGTGVAGFSGDGGAAVSAQLNEPAGITLDDSGNLYIADLRNNRIRKISVAGTISTIAGTGALGYAGDGTLATAATLNCPNTIGLDNRGNKYIIDSGSHIIRKISASGIITTFAGTPGTAGYSGDGGLAVSAMLDGPVGIAVNDSGTVYFADGNNDRIRKIDNAGYINTVAGNGLRGYTGDGGAATLARLSAPWGVTIDTMGNLYIADGFNNSIRKIDLSRTITTVAGSNGYVGDGGAATSAALHTPMDITFDKDNNLLIADAGAHTVRKVNGAGIITTLAGTDSAGYSGDGGPANLATLREPVSVATDKLGNVYISDAEAQCIRKIDGATGIITTFAGNGVPGFAGDGGAATAAQINKPWGVAVDTFGDVYFSDNENNRVRKVNVSTGIISTVAGITSAGFSGDGGAAAAAALSSPAYLAFDTSNNLYIADNNNNRIRMVEATSGNITTVLGNGTNGDAGDGGSGPSAQLCSPVGVAIDRFGGITTTVCGKIRHVPAGGRPPVRLDAGSGLSGMTADGISALASAFRGASGITFDATGKLLIADAGNRTVRISTIAFGTSVNGITKGNLDFKMYPNPNNGNFELSGSVTGSITSETLYIMVIDVLGNVVSKTPLYINNGFAYGKVTLGNELSGGVYHCRVIGGNQAVSLSFLVQR